jgi:hypothetical protein
MTTETKETKMEDLLNYYIEQSEEGVAEIQLTMRNGMPIAGAMKAGPLPGTFTIGTVGAHPKTPNEQLMVEVVFRADDVFIITKPMPQSSIVLPKKSKFQI